MNALSLTHAHLKKDGLSPVSCERADSFVGVWAERLGWNIDVVYTKGTKWAGIWPGGHGLQVNVHEVVAPEKLYLLPQELFFEAFFKLFKKQLYGQMVTFTLRRLEKKLRAVLAGFHIARPLPLWKAKKWGELLLEQEWLNKKKYDFIFVCVGHGDEYLLETALSLSQKLNVPMVVDFRDLWSDFHLDGRFTDQQRQIIRKYEIRLLANTVLLSVPQQPMVAALNKFLDIPVHVSPHSAHVDPTWEDGEVVSDEFRILYSGKIYPNNPGQAMVLDMMVELARTKASKPIKCHFYIDDAAKLQKLVNDRNIADHVVIHEWVAPGKLWAALRSAHVLVSFDSGVDGGMPLLMTKTYQYAYTGRPILALCKYGNSTYQQFFDTYDAGVVRQNAQDAAKWVLEIAKGEQQYRTLPALKKVPDRASAALAYGQEIAQRLLKLKGNR